MDNLVLKKKDLAILRFIILSDIGNAIIASQDPEHAPFTTKELKLMSKTILTECQ